MARPGQAWDEGPVAGPPHGVQACRLPSWLIPTWGALLTPGYWGLGVGYIRMTFLVFGLNSYNLADFLKD